MGVYGITDVLHDPANATGVGLLLWAIKTGGKPTWESKAKPAGQVNNVMGMLKKFFGA
jgi:cell division protein FtsA